VPFVTIGSVTVFGADEDYFFLFFGQGRHPCTGVKVAKLEIKMIVALFVVGYEHDVVDSGGGFPERLPVPDLNDIHQVRVLCKFIVQGLTLGVF